MTRLIILGYFIPNSAVGGPYRSIYNLINAIKDKFDIYVISPNNDVGSTEKFTIANQEKWCLWEGVLTYFININFFTPLKVIWQLNKNINTNTVIYLNSVFNFQFSIAVLVAKKFFLLKKAQIVVTPRGEIFEESLNFSPHKKKIFIRLSNIFFLYKNIRWHATNEKEKECIIKIFNIQEDNILIAPLISDQTEVPPILEREELRPLKIIWLARIAKDKNFPYSLEVLGKIKETEIQYDVYGYIRDQNILDESLTLIENLPKNISYEYKGIVDKKDVLKTLNKYDLFFLPTFSENFGHSIAESLTVGTPILISDMTPWRNLEKEELGWDIKLTQPEKYIQKIQEVAEWSSGERVRRRKIIREYMKRINNDPTLVTKNINLFS